MKKDWIIAIDPSVNRSGYAEYRDGRFVEMKSLSFSKLMQEIANKHEATILVEDSRMVKGNWHGVSARGNVGKNKATCKLIIDMFESMGLNVTPIPPAGYSQTYCDQQGRFTRLYEAIFKADTGWTKPSNKDSRAAAAMVLSYLKILRAVWRKMKKQK